MLRLLRNSPGRITAEVYDVTGALEDPPAVPAVSVVDGAGAAVANGNSVKDAVDAVGQYHFDLTAAQLANMDTYTATWTAAFGGNPQTYTSMFEVVGGFYFTVSDARAYDGGRLADTGAFSDAAIRDARATVEERFEAEMTTAFVPRGARILLDGSYVSPTELQLYHPTSLRPLSRLRKVNTISVNGTPLLNTDYANIAVYPEDGRLHWTQGIFAWGYKNVSAYFEYGYDQAPKPIHDAALDYLRALLMPTNEDERVINQASEMDTRGAVMGDLRSRWRPTGIPRIDSVLWRYNDRLPGMA